MGPQLGYWLFCFTFGDESKKKTHLLCMTGEHQSSMADVAWGEDHAHNGLCVLCVCNLFQGTAGIILGCEDTLG